ncbi:hypothetical protein [Serratia proteamaculans]
MYKSEENRRRHREPPSASKDPNDRIVEGASRQYHLPAPQRGPRDTKGIPSVSSRHNKKEQKDVEKYADDKLVTAIYKIKVVKKSLLGKEKSYESVTDIKTFEDKYHGGKRLNVLAHGNYDDLTKKFHIASSFDKKGHILDESESYKMIASGKGKVYYVDELYRELIKRYPDAFDDTADPTKGFKVIRLLSCHSADGGGHSGGQELANLTNIKVQAHLDDLDIDLWELIIGVGLPFSADSKGWKIFKPHN